MKINSGMTEVLRPSLYGAQHPIVIYPQNNSSSVVNDGNVNNNIVNENSDEKVPYVVVSSF